MADLIFKLLLIVSIINLVLCNDCPDAKLLDPCTCNQSSITCGGEKAIDLVKIFEKLSKRLNDRRKHFYELVINNTFITELTEDMFKDLKFHTIFIYEAHSLTKFHPNTFQGTKGYTKVFVIKKCRNFDSLELFDIMNSFANIETISIGNININEIPANVFKPLTKLYSVAFTGPNFKKIGEKAFHELNTIKYIDIINTSISHIDDNMFVFKNSAVKVNIGLFFNQLDGTSFSSGSFAHIRRPAEFHYMGYTEDENSDRIKFLDQNVFEPFFKANKENRIVLKYELLDCNDCRNKWLKTNHEYTKKVELLRCSNGRPFDAQENFASC